MTNDIATTDPQDNPYFDTDWLDTEALSDRAPNPKELGFELGYFVSDKRYRRESGLKADIAVYGLFTFKARGLIYKDGYYRLVVPAGRKPLVLKKHLEALAPGLDFYLMMNNTDEWAEHLDEWREQKTAR